jgi:regulator of cell morphogenesis and NO signaling
MTVVIDKTVRELALENPLATSVFERLGIDYCCGGNQSLREACRRANVSADKVLDGIEQVEQADLARREQRDWQIQPLAALIAHIQNTHHKYTREELARLQPLFEKVCAVHGKNHPELLEIQESFRNLAQELSAHMMKEEMILFPYISTIEGVVARSETIARPPFGSIRKPVSMMEHEHNSAGNTLRAMRQASNGYSAPADSCVSYKTLYTALAMFEADLHQHIHLENNILFPRAVAIENGR